MRASSSRTNSSHPPPIRVYLFHNGLWLITPLTWLLFVLNLMGYFFLISWTPTLLAAAKLPQATAALAGAALQIGGTVGALVLCWWLQRHRFFAIAILFVLAVPVVASIGYAGMTSPTVLLAATFLGGFLVLGIQSGINVSARWSIRPRSAPTAPAGSLASAVWIDRRPAARGIVRRAVGREAVRMVGAAVRRRRNRLLRRSRTEHGAARRPSRTGKGSSGDFVLLSRNDGGARGGNRTPTPCGTRF